MQKSIFLSLTGGLLLLGSISASGLTILSQCDAPARMSVTVEPDPAKGCIFPTPYFPVIGPGSQWSKSLTGCKFLVAIVGGQIRRDVPNDATLTLVNAGQICQFQ